MENLLCTCLTALLILMNSLVMRPFPPPIPEKGGTGNSIEMINGMCCTCKKYFHKHSMFYILIGCDNTLAWKGLPAITGVFEHLSQNPFEDI